MEMNVVCVAAP